jgi:hypothetical protein
VAALQLSNTDRSRREKLVGMPGSAFEGERLNALSMLEQMAGAYKVPIHELLLGDGSGGAGSSFDRQRAEQAAREARRTRPGEQLRTQRNSQGNGGTASQKRSS